MTVPFRTQQLMWSQFISGCDSYHGPDRRQSYVTGVAHGYRLATTRPTFAPEHTGMKASYTGILGHAASVSRDPSAAKALLMFQQHLQELGRRYYAGDVKVVDEFLQLYSVAPSERADAMFDQAHPNTDTVTAAEAMLAIPIDLRSRLLEAHDFSHFSSEAAGVLPQSVLADLRKLCDLMRAESKTAGITHQQAPTAAQAAQPAAELTATRSSPSATLAHQ